MKFNDLPEIGKPLAEGIVLAAAEIGRAMSRAK